MADIDITISANSEQAVAAMGKLSKEAEKIAASFEQQFARLSLSLNGATKTDVARASLSSLDDMLKRGKISADQYGAAFNQIALKSGLTTEAAQDMASRIIQLNQQFQRDGDADKYAAGIAKIQSELKDAAPKTRSLGENIVILNQALELGGKILEGFKRGFEFAKQGAEVERLEVAFQNLGKSEADLEVLRRASLGTISDQNLMLAANKANLLGVGTSTEQLSKLLQVAAVRGRAMGLDTTQAFGDIVTGIGRLSPRILDNLGIITESKTTYEKYAASIGKTAEKLTDAEKRQALFNKVLAESEKLGPLTEDNATKFERLEATLDNLGNTAKKALADIVLPAVEGLNTVLDVAANGSDNLREAFVANQDQMIKAVLAGEMSLEDYNRGLEGTARAAGLVKVQMDSYATSSRYVDDAVKFLTADQVELIRTQQEAAGMTDAVDRAMRRSAESTAAAADSSEDLKGAQDALKESLKGLDDLIAGEVGKEVTNFTEKQAGLRDKSAELKAEIDRLSGAQGYHTSINKKNALTADELAAAQTKLAAVTEDLTLKTRKKNETDAEFAARMAALTVQADNLRDKIGGASGAVKSYIDNSKKIGELTEKYDEVNAAIQQNAAEHDRATKQILFNMAEQQLAADGLTATEVTALTSLAEKWGLVDQATATATQNVLAAVSGLATDGNIDVFKDRMNTAMMGVSGDLGNAEMHAEQLKRKIDALKDKTVTIKINYHEQGSVPQGHTGPGGSLPGAATGADFIVPPNPRGGSGDYFPVMAAPGERVTVSTPSQQRGGRGDGPLVGQIIIQAQPGMNEEQLAQVVIAKLGALVRASRGNGYGAMGA